MQWLAIPGLLACLGMLSRTELTAEDYPMSKRIDHVETLHGVEIPDPYRWLEQDVRESREVADWVRAQNEHTEAFLEQIPQRERINKRLTELWDFERFGTPFRAGGRIYFFKNDGLQDQYVLYVQETLEDEPRVLIDPNTWSEDGTLALANAVFSEDGRYVAYSRQEGGSDWRVWRIMELASGRELDEELHWVKFNLPAWTPDGDGFFYARFPEPEEGERFQTLNLNQALYYHRAGTPQSEDVLVFHRPDHPEWGYHGIVTEDGNYLIVIVTVGTDDRYRVFYKDLRQPFGMPVSLIHDFENEYSFVGNDGPVFYFKTDLEAPRGRVIAIDIRDVPAGIDVNEAPEKKGEPPPHRELIPQQPETIRDASLVGNLFIVEFLKDAKTEVGLYQLDGRLLRHIDFPGIGSASGFRGLRTHTDTFYSFSSFDTPPSIFRYDLYTGESTLLRQAEVDFDPREYEVRQVFYESKDGTRIPMFLSHRKGLELDGENPVLLYGYGGFNIALTPSFSISRLAWMEMGGVFAMANLRGGGEYGEQWHQAGKKLNKQNVFDDFIAAAEWLIENRYTSPEKLAIQGGSNGGLLVGACITQRPELYGAALAAVGVLDMLRFHKFTAGRYWVDDYGSADDPEQFRALLAYSPYHNVKEGVCYPPTLITTADTDDRVVPAHSFKFTAALQHAQSCGNPILIRIETKAGHGAGKPTSKIIEELTDQWSFLVKLLRMEVTSP